MTREWTEGVCDDGAALLRDGAMMRIEDILTILNQHEALLVRLQQTVWTVLPTYAQCEEKTAAGEATALERFIQAYEPAGVADEDWRLALAEVLDDSTMEDRWSCLPERAI